MHPWKLFQGGFLPADAERVCKHHSKEWGLQKIKTYYYAIIFIMIAYIVWLIPISLSFYQSKQL